jgi:hypothetical protein
LLRASVERLEAGVSIYGKVGLACDSAPTATKKKIELGDRFEMHHPRLGRLDIFEAVEISDPTIRLRATGAGYWNEMDRLIVGQIENLMKYKLTATSGAAAMPRDLAQSKTSRNSDKTAGQL